MSEDETESTKQTLDLVIVNSNILELNEGIIIRWYLSKYGLDVDFNLTIREDEVLYDTPTFETFPKDAVIYTHLAANSSPHFVTLVGVYKLTEDLALRKYRPDLRFIIAIDDMYLDENEFFKLWKGNRRLFNFLQNLSEQQLDPANIVSSTYQRNYDEFFTNEPRVPDNDNFKDYVEKLLALRAGQAKQTNEIQEGN